MSTAFQLVGGNYACPARQKLEQLSRQLHAHLVVKGRHQPYYGCDILVDRDGNGVKALFITIIRLLSRIILKDNPLRVCSVQGLRDALFEAASFYRLGDGHLMEWILNCKVGTFTLCNRIYHSYVSAIDAGLKGLMAVMKAPPLACLGTFIGCNPILAASDTADRMIFDVLGRTT
jgi:hypothetical protein